MALVLGSWQRALPFAVTAAAAALVGGLAVWSLRPGTSPRPTVRFNHALLPEQVFRSTGRSVMAVSPDGRSFVYNTAEGLYIRSMDALEARLVPGTEAPLVNPFFSPDGRSIGYFDGRLMRIPVAGGAPVVICPVAATVFGASWGTDNDILFAQPGGIMRVPADGGIPELVVQATEGEQIDGPQMLPGGDLVLFSVTRATGAARWNRADVVVQSVSTGERTVVLQGGSDARYVSTGHLVYAQGDALLVVAFDIARRRAGGGPVPVVEGLARAFDPAVNTAAANYGVSNDGTLVHLQADSPGAFHSAGPAGRVPPGVLVWVDRSGREEGLGAPRRAYVNPRLSPNGTRVALDSRDEGLDIWIWDIARRTLTPLTYHPALDLAPVWTPDGQRVVFSSTRAGGPLNLYWQPSDGTGTLDRLVDSPNVQRPFGFTPDGKRLLLAEGASTGEQQDLGLLSMDGDRSVTWLTRTASSEISAEISPDGRWLAYESSEAGRRQVWVRAFPDVNRGRWLVSPNGGSQPLWAPSGRELFYIASDGTLMGVPVDAAQDGARFDARTPSTVMARGSYRLRTGNQAGRTYDVTPDGERFLRIKINDGPDTNGPRNFVIVRNWFEELNRLHPW
jgi:serine/threonine-protein kinase